MISHAQLAQEAGTTTEQQVARVYAEALLNQAWKNNQGPETLEELQGLVGMLRQLPDFAGFLHSPGISREARAEVLSKALKGASAIWCSIF